MTSRVLSEAEHHRISNIDSELQAFLETIRLDDDDKNFLTSHFYQLKEALVGAFKENLPNDVTTMNIQQLHDLLAASKNTISSHLHLKFNKPIESPNPDLMRMGVVYMKFIDAFERSLGISNIGSNTSLNR